MSRRRSRRKQPGWKKLLRSLLAAALLMAGLAAARQGAFRQTLEDLLLPAPQMESGFSMHMIDVGQGQALLITCGEEAAMVDAGLSGSAESMIQYIRDRGVRRLNYLFITHPHTDHCGGAKKLLAAIPTDTLVTPHYFAEEALLSTAGEWIGTAGTQLDISGAGRTYSLGDATITVLHPEYENEIDEMNELSLVLRVEYGGKTLLLTGDIPRSVEQALLPLGHVDLLQSPHHGSGGSNCAAFLEDLSPDYVFISCGKDNDYGHPHASALENMEAVDAQIWRTDQQGSVVFRIQEGQVTVSGGR